MPATAIYRFSSGGQMEAPPIELPGGGWLAMTGLNPGVGKVQLDVVGIDSEPELARLSLDVTRKPQINLVWYGLYIVLAGGGLATWKRFRGARKVDSIPVKAD